MALLSPGKDEQSVAPLSVVATRKSEWVSFNEEAPCPVPSNGGTEKRPSSSSESPSEEDQRQDGETQGHLCLSELAGPTDKAGGHSPPGEPCFLKSDLSASLTTWVQFEEAAWNGSAPALRQTDRNGLASGTYGRRSLTSESSWTTHSEDTSSPSIAPSYTDLRSAMLEEASSGGASGPDSVGKFTQPDSYLEETARNASCSQEDCVCKSVSSKCTCFTDDALIP
ncbi:stonin-2-like [Rhinatrema bivittatum]|uniref:stonin-2-like n=1 Tax=Rhinatrema bivittatum TaxID=194408 RepID=UPI00112E9B3B|nr:stonin-2-like [Rhinatrema bivittatum]